MKQKIPDNKLSEKFDAALRAELLSVAVDHGADCAEIATEIYHLTLALICARAKEKGLESAMVLDGLARLFSAVDKAAVEASLFCSYDEPRGADPKNN
jgi:hypothetical protein